MLVSTESPARQQSESDSSDSTSGLCPNERGGVSGEHGVEPGAAIYEPRFAAVDINGDGGDVRTTGTRRCIGTESIPAGQVAQRSCGAFARSRDGSAPLLREFSRRGSQRGCWCSADCADNAESSRFEHSSTAQPCCSQTGSSDPGANKACDFEIVNAPLNKSDDPAEAQAESPLQRR